MSVDAHIRSEVIERRKEIQSAERLQQRIVDGEVKLVEIEAEIENHCRHFFCLQDPSIFDTMAEMNSRTILQTKLATRLRNMEPSDEWQSRMSSLQRQRTEQMDHVCAIVEWTF